MIERVDRRKLDDGLGLEIRVRAPAQRAVDLTRRPLAHADRLGHEARNARDIAAGVHAIEICGLPLIDLKQRTVGVEHALQRREVGVLSDGRQDRVRLEREIAVS